jgi:hypothetical protein
MEDNKIERSVVLAALVALFAVVTVEALGVAGTYAEPASHHSPPLSLMNWAYKH